MSKGTRAIGVILAVCATGALAPAASAATRFASPTGSGPAASCPQANPCEIHAATESGSVSASDTVVLLPGTYSLGANDLVTIASVTGQAGAAMPRLVSHNDQVLTITNNRASRLILETDGASSGRALNLIGSGASGDQLSVVATATSSLTQAGIQLRDGADLRDTAVSASAGTGTAIVIGGTGTSDIRGVTAVSTTAATPAIVASDAFAVPQPAAITANVRNTIARGVAQGILADDNGDAGDNIDVHVDHSNFSSLVGVGEGQVFDDGGNQTAAPLFASGPAGVFHQAPGSPTIDVGTSAGSSSVDFEDDPRPLGAAPDIGADEAPDGASVLELGSTKLKRKRKLSIPASCPVFGCNVALAARLVVKGKRASKSKVIALKGSSASLAAGAPASIVVTLKKSVLKQLKAARKGKLNVTASVTESLGFTGTEQAAYKFK